MNSKNKMSIDPEKWMSHLNDDLKLSQIILPGTHDSSAYECNVLAKCQHMNLEQQLRHGVRFLDIRCRHMNDEFRLFHSSFDLNKKFADDVVRTCVNFLRANPTETVLMLVSPEYKELNNKTTKFDQLFLSYIESTARDHWYLHDDLPSLGQARGRIVLLRRFFSPRSPLGIDMSGWRHNSTFLVKNHENFRVFIQDEYKLGSKAKWDRVKHLLDNLLVFRGDPGRGESSSSSEQGDELVWNWNYCSAQNWPNLQPPKVVAWTVNKLLKDYILLNKFDFSLHSNGYANGMILIVDFADKKLVENILFLNFSKIN